MRTGTQLEPNVQLRLFGSFGLAVNGQTVEGHHLRHARSILAYLALHANTWIEKEALAFKIWNYEKVDDPVRNLDGSLVYITKLLGDARGRLQRHRGELKLILEPEDADTLQFMKIANRTDISREEITTALALSSAPLLEDWRDAWVSRFRAEFNLLRGDLIRKLQDLRVSEGSNSHTHTDDADHRTGSIGGTVPADSRLYIERTADNYFRRALQDNDSCITIKGAPESGKSSLLARGLGYARQIGRVVIETDCSLLSSRDFETQEAFYSALLSMLAEGAGCEYDPTSDWKTHMSANYCFMSLLSRRILGHVQHPTVWAIDSIDLVLRHPYRDDFCSLLRGLYTKRSVGTEANWMHLTVVTASSTEPHLFISDLRQSPFNVGTRIALDDFTLEEVRDLARRFSIPFTEAETQQVFTLLGGHPYLTTRCLHRIKTAARGFSQFEETAAETAGPFHDHLTRLRDLILRDPDLHNAVRSILESGACDSKSFFRLKSAGVIIGNNEQTAKFRCKLYERYLKRNL